MENIYCLRCLNIHSTDIRLNNVTTDANGRQSLYLVDNCNVPYIDYFYIIQI